MVVIRLFRREKIFGAPPPLFSCAHQVFDACLVASLKVWRQRYVNYAMSTYWLRCRERLSQRSKSRLNRFAIINKSKHFEQVLAGYGRMTGLNFA